MTFDVPILFLGYNRPDLTHQVLNRILQINPQSLFISLDGANPYKVGDSEKCRLVQNIVSKLSVADGVLNVRVNKSNLGCKNSVKSAIDWFFEHIEYGIILEDDCFPSLSFFHYCKELLEKYKTDDRISHVSGSNFQYGIWRGFSSYYFSKYTHIWGWATWRRAWKDYDITMRDFERSFLFSGRDILLPIDLMRDVYLGKIDTWDMQWFYTNILHKRLTIVPNTNLVKNLGFNNDATHTHGNIYSYIRNTPNGDLVFPLKHKSHFAYHKSADSLVAVKVFGQVKNRKISKWLFKFNFIFDRYISKIKARKIVKHLFVLENEN
jgi:hypothetical protein